MRLGISAGFLCEPQWTGVQRYVFEMVTALAAARPDNTIVMSLVVPRALRQRAMGIFSQTNVCVRTLALPARTVLPVQFFWQQLLWPPVEMVTGPLDAYLSGGGFYLPSRAAVRGGFVFDMSPFATQYSQNVSNQRAEQARLTAMARDSASLWIAISELTEKRAQTYFHLPKQRTMVAYPGQSLPTKPLSKRAPMEKSYVLFVGSLTSRKNIPRLLDAFALARRQRPELSLVLIGHDPEGMGRKSRDGVITLGYVPEEEMIAWYRGAMAVAYPSLEEGFGLPVLEAMTLGVVPITSSGSSMEEIVGADWPLLVDATSTESIRDALVDVATMRYAKRKLLVARAIERGRQFSYSRSAELVWRRLERMV